MLPVTPGGPAAVDAHKSGWFGTFGLAQMQQMMEQQNQAINTAAKAGHDQQMEVNRNLK